MGSAPCTRGEGTAVAKNKRNEKQDGMRPEPESSDEETLVEFNALADTEDYTAWDNLDQETVSVAIHMRGLTLDFDYEELQNFAEFLSAVAEAVAREHPEVG